MEILYLLLPLSALLLFIAVLAFRWALQHRQFDDLQSPALIPLQDDELEAQARNGR